MWVGVGKLEVGPSSGKWSSGRPKLGLGALGADLYLRVGGGQNLYQGGQLIFEGGGQNLYEGSRLIFEGLGRNLYEGSGGCRYCVYKEYFKDLISRTILLPGTLFVILWGVYLSCEPSSPSVSWSVRLDGRSFIVS